MDIETNLFGLVECNFKICLRRILFMFISEMTATIAKQNFQKSSFFVYNWIIVPNVNTGYYSYFFTVQLLGTNENLSLVLFTESL